MFGKRMARWLIGLGLCGATCGTAWHLRPVNRLLRQRTTLLLDYRKEPDTRGYWLDAQTLLLITSNPHQGYREPDQWTGKVQRLDIRSRKRTPDSGLTHLLNSLHAEPMNCQPAPGGPWLLWTVADHPDHYPNAVTSTLDGKHHYHWEAGKFEGWYWVNAHQWVHHRRDIPYDAPDVAAGETQLPPVYVDDVNTPEKEQKLPANSTQALSLLAGMVPNGKEYDLEPREDSAPSSEWRLAQYDVGDYHLSVAPRPLHTVALDLPRFQKLECSAFLSPDHQHVLYELRYEQASPFLQWLHRVIPRVNAPTQAMVGLWVSNVEGSNLHEIGHMVSTDQYAVRGFQWLPDNRHVSWHDQDGLYAVSAE